MNHQGGEIIKQKRIDYFPSFPVNARLTVAVSTKIFQPVEIIFVKHQGRTNVQIEPRLCQITS